MGNTRPSRASSQQRLTSIRDWARAYAQLGWFVLPLKERGKKPHLCLGAKGGYHHATTDLDQIEEWWTKYPNANVGIACARSGLIVPDIDISNGKVGEETWSRLIEEKGALPETVEAVSGSGGRHVVFATNGSVAPSSVGDGIDVKYNGYIVAPPSIHPDTGEPYRWKDGASPFERELSSAPQWLVDGSGNGSGPEEEGDWLEAVRRSEKGRALWEGDISRWDDDHSRADFALANILVAALGPRPRLVKQAFKQSGTWKLATRSAHHKREDYLDLTIEKAFDKFQPKSREQRRKGKPAEALAESRVDLVQLIRDGVPPREYVPGNEPWLIVGKRYLIPGTAGSGKSLVAALIAVSTVAAGGTAAILDVENGAEEYATRLEDVLHVLDPDGSLAEACSERLHYHVWPTLRMDWTAEDWAAANEGHDLVIFDSSRLVLSGAGLKEDSSDDYRVFVNALLMPLSRLGVTTIVLDNTGWEDERSRGTKSKYDLNEVVYFAKVRSVFDRDQLGELHLERQRTRFADLPQVLRVPLGDGTFGPISVVVEENPVTEDDVERDKQYKRTTIDVLGKHEAGAGLSKNKLFEAVQLAFAKKGGQGFHKTTALKKFEEYALSKDNPITYRLGVRDAQVFYLETPEA